MGVLNLRAALALIRLKRRCDSHVYKSTLTDVRTLLHVH
ncbi:hypothetical protein OKW29_000860 [Paraburkholderia sp. CI3]